MRWLCMSERENSLQCLSLYICDRSDLSMTVYTRTKAPHETDESKPWSRVNGPRAHLDLFIGGATFCSASGIRLNIGPSPSRLIPAEVI